MSGQASPSDLYEHAKRGLCSLGYEQGLLREEYQFADILSHDLRVKTITLAAFFQEPPSYHSACFGVVVGNGQSGLELVSGYRSLGAPQLLEIGPFGMTRWGMPSRGEPHRLEDIGAGSIAGFFDSHKHDWSPRAIREMKTTVGKPSGYQLDFFDMGLLPLLDRQVQLKFDRLLTQTISESGGRIPTQDSPRLFRLIFRLIAAKILADRKHEGNWLQSDPRAIVKNVQDFYFRTQRPEPVLDDPAIQNAVWERIRSDFHFQNLSVETLAYVYENTLITKDFRRRTSTHGTPPSLADYIVRRLPFEDLQQQQRTVFEPFSGHAVFLVAALRRLRELLPGHMTDAERHSYFVNMLVGLEYDEFAREIARLSLILADYPNPDGWQLHQGDVFKESESINRELLRANVVLSNPPFEDFTEEEKKAYPDRISNHKPADILGKVLSKPPRLLGFVLPRIFISGRGYEQARRAIGDYYSSVEILELPDNTFKYSDAETVLLIASGTRTKSIHLATAEVYKGQLDAFYSTYVPSYSDQEEIVDPSAFARAIWLPELRELWRSLGHEKTLEDCAPHVHRGIEYNFSVRDCPELAVSDHEKPGFVGGLHRVSDGLEPFLIRGRKFLNARREQMRGEAYLLPWQEPKVVLNARRRTRGHWKITSAPDYEGLWCYQSLHSIWPKPGMPLEVLSAVLNGPIANAFVSTHDGQRDIRVDTLKRVPMPNISPGLIDSVTSLVRHYQAARKSWLIGDVDAVKGQRECSRLIRAIDALVLQAYELPTRLEHMLLDYFSGSERPVPFLFTSYYSTSLRTRIGKLQDHIRSVPLLSAGPPEERMRHRVEVLESLDDIRKRANTARLGES